MCALALILFFFISLCLSPLIVAYTIYYVFDDKDHPYCVWFSDKGMLPHNPDWSQND